MDTASLANSFLSRFAPRAGFVALRQTFVLPCHAWQRLKDEEWFGEQTQPDARAIEMGAGGGAQRGLITALQALGTARGRSNGLGIGAAQKGAGSKPIERRHWVASLIVGILVALLIAVGMSMPI